MAVLEPDTHTTSVMSATQLLKSELLMNVCGYFIHQDPMPILFIQPTQDAAAAFAKERFGPTVDATPVLRVLIEAPRAGSNENTLTHKDFPGGNLDFVGAHSPLDLASRPRPVILSDEINKFPASAGDEGDPLSLAEECASTFVDIGRATFVRTCSPTIRDACRIGRKGMSGNKPLWPTNAIRSKSNDHLLMLGVDTGKDALFGRLKIKDPGPGYIHFPADDAFGEHYFAMLTAERREVRKRTGQSYTVWTPIRERNEALDTFVGALAVRRSLPRRIERGLGFAVVKPELRTADPEPMHRRVPEDDMAKYRYSGREPGMPRLSPNGRPKRRSDWLGGSRKGWL